MDTVLATVAIGIVVFASTNIDEILLLSAFFVDPQLRPRAIVAGQFLGIGVLVLASAGAALAAMVVPKGWIALLGFIPLALGLRRLFALRRSQPDALELDQVQNREQRIVQRTHSQVPAVAVVTIANGGDNLGVYIPLFASDLSAIPVYTLIFAIMTALWCWIGYRLVYNRPLGARIRRYRHLVLPFVLIALGLAILSNIPALIPPPVPPAAPHQP